MCIAIVFKPGFDVMNFEFSNQAVFPTWSKGRDKNLNIKNEKSF